jgi:hypothetical protein
MTHDHKREHGPQRRVPPGSEFAYEVAREQLSRSLERVNRADTKAGILVGVLAAAVGAFLLLELAFVARVLIGIPLIASTLLVATSLLITCVQDAPSPQAVARVVDAAPAETKSALVPTLIEAYEWTNRQAARKERFLSWGIALTVVGGVIAVAIKVIRG